MNKKCFKCKQVKSIDLYYKHKQMLDGHLNKCKACTKKDVRRRYYDPESRERIREYDRKRFQTAERKEKVAEYQRTHRSKYPGKARARRKGSHLETQPCHCGEVGQAHHPDYRKPTEVEWLCFKHHREEHGQTVA